MWKAVFEAGADYGIQPIGLAARDTLRLEMGYCLYGNEIDDTTSPIAAGLGWVTRPATNFLNASQLEEEKKQGTAQKLVGFELTERGIPRTGHVIVNKDGESIGRVTSGTQSPSLEKAIGLGYVPLHVQKWQFPFAQIRNKTIPAKVVSLPFYRQENKSLETDINLRAKGSLAMLCTKSSALFCDLWHLLFQ